MTNIPSTPVSVKDGSYYAKGDTVWKRPVETRGAGGSKISFGFPVCQMSDIVGEEGAETVAELMNQGDELPKLRSDLATARKALEEIEDLVPNQHLKAIARVALDQMQIAQLREG